MSDLNHFSGVTNMGKTLIILLIVLSILAISGVAIARYKGYCHGPEGKANWLVDRVSSKLELDDHQQQQLSKFRDRTFALVGQLRNEKPQQIEQAMLLLDSPVLDREQAYQMLETKQNWVATAGPQLIDAFAEFSDSLNDAQRSKLQAMLKRHRQHHHGCCDDPFPATQE